MRKSSVKEAISRVLWGEDPRECTIVFIDRLSPTGERVVRGDEVAGFNRMGYIVLKDGGLIPPHRVVRVECRGRVLLDRR